MRRKTILVTGGAGFIGSHLCKKLLENGHEVVAVDNLITSTGENLRDLSRYDRFRFIYQDICSSRLFSDLYDFRFDEIFHLACPTGVPNLTRLSREMLETNSIGTQNILEISRMHQARFLFTSSSEVYGNPLTSPQSETYNGNVHSIGERSPYEEGKRFSESLSVAYMRRYAIDVRIARIFNTYGPGASFQETRVIPKFIRCALKNESIPVQGEGSQKRTFCYVDDLVSGLIIVMEKGSCGAVYNIGGVCEYTIGDIASIVIKSTGSISEINYIHRPGHDHDARLPDISRIKKLGWVPKVSLDEGIRKTIQAE